MNNKNNYTSNNIKTMKLKQYSENSAIQCREECIKNKGQINHNSEENYKRGRDLFI